MNAQIPPAPEPVVAIVGATGAVGLALIHSLEQRGFPVAQLRLLASARSVDGSHRIGRLVFIRPSLRGPAP